ncbi:DUF4272 domain-containing protein [Paenibacillus turpanensis]|uniref:DUF4272 domain-containing protein n=1 Tax=Paenibacillus turpanensis TaxID=2689078 RepID=UPI00140835A5|nr:DUF4272 domain-containing protein [Paenibacillus turpanensis]
MRFFTIFASRNDTDDIDGFIIDVFEKGFKITRSGREYLLRSKKIFGKNNMTIRVETEETDPNYFSGNMPGMMNFYDRIPFEEEELKTKVLMQISVLNTMIAIQTEKEYSDNDAELFYKLLAKVNGIGFIPNGTLIGSDGEVIVYPDGSSGASNFTPTACTKKVRGEELQSSEGDARKRNTEAFLQEKGIPVNAALPQLPAVENIRLRSQEEAARRAVASLIVIQYACDVAQDEDIEASKDFVLGLLDKYGVEDALTEQEREFLAAEEPDRHEAVQIAWQYEAQWVLLWALGLVETLDFPSETCDSLYAIKTVSECESFTEFYEQTTMRSAEEILEQADLVYRMHWACVNDRIHGRAAAAEMQESIVVERRRGLFWLIGHRDEAWDAIGMDT